MAARRKAKAGAKSLDINRVAAGFIGKSGRASTSGITQPPSQPTKINHWTSAVCLDSPVLKRMNQGQRLTASAVYAAAARVKGHLNPGSPVGWAAEPVLLEQLAGRPPVLRFCAGVDAFGQKCKVPLRVLDLIANYPGYDRLEEDLAAAYATLGRPVPTEDAEYKFLRDLAAAPQLLQCVKQLRKSRMSELAHVPDSVATLVEEFPKLQNAYFQCVNAENAAIKALEAASDALAAAQEQRFELLSPVMAQLSQMQDLTNSSLTAEELASAQEAHRSSPLLQESCSISCFLETLRMKKVAGNVAASMPSFSKIDPAAFAAEIASKTQEAAKNVEQTIEGLHACIKMKYSATASRHHGNVASSKSADPAKDIVDLVGIWEASLREAVPSREVVPSGEASLREAVPSGEASLNEAVPSGEASLREAVPSGEASLKEAVPSREAVPSGEASLEGGSTLIDE
jgi:hypothetical protein